MNFVGGGVQQGTIDSASAQSAPARSAPAAGPPRPPAIPAHYIFDEESELWMPPTALKKPPTAPAPSTALATTDNGIQVIRSDDVSQAAPYLGTSEDSICFEYTNSGTCGRLNRGEICRYRHLTADHPDVIADKVRQGKLPPTALDAAKTAASLAAGIISPGFKEEDLPDPGPTVRLGCCGAAGVWDAPTVPRPGRPCLPSQLTP